MGVRFNKQGNGQTKEVCLGQVQDKYILVFANQNLYIKVYTEVLILDSVA